MGLFSGPGLTPNLKGLATNVISLAAGECWTIFPAGWYMTRPGKFTCAQQFDPITGIWRQIGAGEGTSGGALYFYSDGINYRLANQTGCTVGAIVTAGGTGYTSAPTVTSTGGGNPIFRAIVGGLVSTSVTVTNGGVNYTYAPIVLFSAPPPGGVQATGHCVISAGAVTSVVVDDQGAGYSNPPTITFTNDPREGINGVTQGYNAAAVATLTGSGVVAAIVVIDHGSPLTGQTAVPTLTITGGGGSSATATAIVDWTIQNYSVTSSGTGYTGGVLISAYGPVLSGAAYTNPTIQYNLVKGRQAQIVAALAGANITATSQTVNDGGVYAGVPNLITYYNTPPTTGAVLGFTLGSSGPDVSYVTPV
jgi:hypothetical protein